MNDLLTEIVNSGRCHGCGACAAFAAPQKITMAMTAQGYLRPASRDWLNKVEEERLRRVCSGREIVRSPIDAGSAYHDTWGPIASVNTGYAMDPQVRYRGS